MVSFGENLLVASLNKHFNYVGCFSMNCQHAISGSLNCFILWPKLMIEKDFMNIPLKLFASHGIGMFPVL